MIKGSLWIPDTYSISFLTPTSYEVRDGAAGLVLAGVYTSDATIAFAGDEDPLIHNERHEKLRALDRALSKLSEDHRIVVLLHDTEGYKLNEIQKLTGIPVGTVKSRLHRARARLREILTQDGTLS